PLSGGQFLSFLFCASALVTTSRFFFFFSSDYAGAVTRRSSLCVGRSSHDGIATAIDRRHAGAEPFAANGGGVRGGGGPAGQAFPATAGPIDERGPARLSGTLVGAEGVLVAVQSDRVRAAPVLRHDVGARRRGTDATFWQAAEALTGGVECGGGGAV